MYPQATWIYAELTKLAESEEELDNIGFFPIPATHAADSIAYTKTPTGFVIPVSGKKADLAAQIVGELVSKEAMTEYYKLHQGIPAVNLSLIHILYDPFLDQDDVACPGKDFPIIQKQAQRAALNLNQFHFLMPVEGHVIAGMVLIHMIKGDGKIRGRCV